MVQVCKDTRVRHGHLDDALGVRVDHVVERLVVAEGREFLPDRGAKERRVAAFALERRDPDVARGGEEPFHSRVLHQGMVHGEDQHVGFRRDLAQPGLEASGPTSRPGPVHDHFRGFGDAFADALRVRSEHDHEALAAALLKDAASALDGRLATNGREGLWMAHARGAPRREHEAGDHATTSRRREKRLSPRTTRSGAFAGPEMGFHIERNTDWRVADGFERGVGWVRGANETARRFGLPLHAHFVATDDVGRAVGGGSATVHRELQRPAVPPTAGLAWIAGMVVEPDARRQGIGRALFQETVKFSEANGARVIGLDATEEGRPLYEAEGWVPAGTSSRWSRPADADRPPLHASPRHRIFPISTAEILELAAYDLPRFGANRSAWIAAVLADLPTRAFVAFDAASGRILGFVLGQEEFVGPLVADAPSVARDLLLATEGAGTPARIHILDDHAGAREMLEAFGYRPEGGSVLRMVRGGPLPGRPETIFGIAAWALG